MQLSNGAIKVKTASAAALATKVEESEFEGVDLETFDLTATFVLRGAVLGERVLRDLRFFPCMHRAPDENDPLANLFLKALPEIAEL